MERLILRVMGLASIGLVAAGGVKETPGTWYSLESPDRRIQVSIQLPDEGNGASLHWSMHFGGKPILKRGGVGLVTAEGDRLAGARLVDVGRRSMDDWIPGWFGRCARAHDRFNEIRFRFQGAKPGGIELIFRGYDDAIALRYELPEKAVGDSVTIWEERTSFEFHGNPRAFVQHLENFRTSHEHNVIGVPYQEIAREQILDMPLTVQWEEGTSAAITEAALRHYAGMSLMREQEGALVCRLTPRADGTKVAGRLPLRTPWRVVLVGERPGALLESATIYCLNDPSVIGDRSWIVPGKLTWPWWNGDVYDGRPGAPILSVEMARRYIDFCERHGIAFHAMTSTETTVTPWYQQSRPGVEPGADTDVTRPREEFDLATIRQYAESKGVRLWTWVHQGALRGRVEEAFAAFSRLGWSGLMVDFFDHDDQETVEYAEAILAAASRHRLMIHFHGIWKPTGMERTYPNLMNHEGALNLEYLKWSDRCTPEHNLMMAFTRLVAGPMDYHLGGFRAVRPEAFEARNVAPLVMGTRGHMLAMYVCFDNPLPMVADYPAAYEEQAGFDFVKRVPTWWDETKVLEGEIGALLVTARRKGHTWYLGGMSAKRGRDLTLPLSFLAAGEYSASTWVDALDTESGPNGVVRESFRLSAAEPLRVRMAVDGGFVAELTPLGK